VSGRIYLVGTIASEYLYDPKIIGDYPNVRRVEWQGEMARDALSVTSRNILGATTRPRCRFRDS